MREIEDLKRICNLNSEDLQFIEDNFLDFSDIVEDAVESFKKYHYLLEKKSEVEGEYSSINYSLYENLSDMQRLSIKLSAYYSDVKMKNIDIPHNLEARIEYMVTNYLKTRNNKDQELL